MQAIQQAKQGGRKGERGERGRERKRNREKEIEKANKRAASVLYSTVHTLPRPCKRRYMMSASCSPLSSELQQAGRQAVSKPYQ